MATARGFAVRAAIVTTVAVSGASCAEQTAAPSSSAGSTCSSTTASGTSSSAACTAATGATTGVKTGSTTGGSTGTNTEGLPAGAFDLCTSGLQTAAALQTGALQTLVADLCGGNPTGIAQLRGVFYTGGAASILIKSEADTATSTQMRLHSSALYAIDIADYWDLVQVQFVNPTAYKGNFEVDPNAVLQDVQPGTGTVSYRYSNDDGSGGAVDYNATTQFLTLSPGQAYVAATVETKMNETMQAFVALIVVNKTADGKTEAFTVSDQTYTFQNGQGTALKQSVSNSTTAEQKRAWANAPNAAKAKPFLTGG